MIKLKAFILLILFLACKEQSTYDYRLTDDKLARLLFDIHFADVILTGHTQEQRDSIMNTYWNKLEETYALSEPEIRDEIARLESDPEKLVVILGKVRVMADSIQR